jgi:hypothetical protein
VNQNTVLKCTCGVAFGQHKGGRCADALVHRILYNEHAQLRPQGTPYFDGLRDGSLFQEDYLFERDGETYLLPNYTSDPRDTWIVLTKWNDTGGTGRINMNATGWSASFNHNALRYGGYYSGNLTRTRFEWLPIRVLAKKAVEVKVTTGADKCEWIDGIEPPDPTDPA